MSAQQEQGREKTEKPKATAVNVFAILGFIALLIIGIWSTVQVIKFVPRLFDQTATGTPPIADSSGISVSLSKESVASGVPVVVSWTREGNEEGILSFAYACEDDFKFAISGGAIVCNEPYGLPSGSTSIELVPILAKTGEVAVPFAVTFTNAEGESVRDTATLIVKNETLVLGDGAPNTGIYDEDDTGTPQTTNVSPTTRAVQVAAVRPSDPYGTADLSVAIVSTGAINQYGAFEARGFVQQYELGAVKFIVTNHGTKETGLWSFRATLPTLQQYTFFSTPQPNLLPGAAVEVLVTFDQVSPAAQNLTITVDPENAVRELSENNNTTGQMFGGSEYYYPYY
jgi:hypothetical protein